MHKKLSLSVGTLKAAAILTLIKLFFSALQLIILLFAINGLDRFLLNNSQLLEKTLLLAPEFAQMIAISMGHVPQILMQNITLVIAMAVLYGVLSIAIKRIKKNDSIKKWAMITLVISAIAISGRDFLLLAIGVLGMISGTNILILTEEK